MKSPKKRRFQAKIVIYLRCKAKKLSFYYFYGE